MTSGQCAEMRRRESGPRCGWDARSRGIHEIEVELEIYTRSLKIAKLGASGVRHPRGGLADSPVPV